MNNQTTHSPALRLAPLGSVSFGTLRAPDLLKAFADTLEGLALTNGEFLCLPENRAMRDRLYRLVGDASDCLGDSGDELADGKEEDEQWLVEKLGDALNEFAPPFSSFCAHERDGSYFGFWPSIDAAKDSVEFVSCRSAEYPESDFQGEWLHVSDHGNVTLYVRTNGEDREVWSIV